MLNEILQIIVGACISVLSVVVPVIVIKLAKLVVLKLNELETKLGSDKFEANKKLALDIAKIVEEKYRLGELVNDKSNEFEKLLVSKIPYLTKEQIDELRNLAVHTFDKEIGKR